MDRKKLEIMVGSFVVMGIVIFCFFVFFISGFYVFKAGYNLYVKYDYISGIAKGSTVQFAGVPVGEVVSFKTIFDEGSTPYIVVKIWIKEGVTVRERSRVEICGAFALSQPHIQITSTGKEEGRPLVDGDYIEGVEAIPMDKLLREGEEITFIMKRMLKDMEAIISESQVQVALKNMILNMDGVTQKLNAAATEEDMKKIVMNLEGSLAELQVAVKNSNVLLNKIEEKEGTVGKLLYDEELYNEMLAFIRDIKLHPWKLLKKGKEQSPDGAEKSKKFLFF